MRNSLNNFFHVFHCLEKKEGAPLKIIRMSHVAGSVEGNKEVWLLSDKIDGNFFIFIINTNVYKMATRDCREFKLM